jgi:hypothetical protein
MFHGINPTTKINLFLAKTIYIINYETFHAMDNAKNGMDQDFSFIRVR